MMTKLLAAALLLLATAATAAPYGVHPQKGTIKDARGAILVARALIIASQPDSPASPEQQRRWQAHWSEQAWLDHCTARLDHGVWIVSNKGLHKAQTGYFTGAAAIYVGADDGRLLGELFVD